jgi:hypothetical protein
MFKLIFPNKNWPPEKMAARKITQKNNEDYRNKSPYVSTFSGNLF